MSDYSPRVNLALDAPYLFDNKDDHCIFIQLWINLMRILAVGIIPKINWYLSQNQCHWSCDQISFKFNQIREPNSKLL